MRLNIRTRAELDARIKELDQRGKDRESGENFEYDFLMQISIRDLLEKYKPQSQVVDTSVPVSSQTPEQQLTTSASTGERQKTIDAGVFATEENPEIEGSVVNSTPCRLGQEVLPFEIYLDPQTKKIRLRKNNLYEILLEGITPNGRIFVIKAGIGQVIHPGWRFRYEGKYYTLDRNGAFLPVQDFERQRIEKLIDNAPKH